MTTEPYPKSYLYKRIVQAKLFIDEHYARDLSLDNISDEAYFSKYHFIRLFKLAYGKTPRQYLIRIRIEKAMQLLKSGTPVSEVCFAVGFESPGSFSSLFKRRVGITPSGYQVQQEKLKSLLQAAPLNFIPGCHSMNNKVSEISNFEEVQNQGFSQFASISHSKKIR